MAAADLESALQEFVDSVGGREPLAFQLAEFPLVLQEIPAFDALVQLVATELPVRTGIELRACADWLVHRLRTASPAEVVASARRGFQAEMVQVDSFLALAGPMLRTRWEVVPGIDVVPYGDVPESTAKRAFERPRVAQMPQPLVTWAGAALRERHSVPWNASRGLPYEWINDEHLWDLARLLALTCPFPVLPLASWQTLHPDVPVRPGESWTYPPDRVFASSGGSLKPDHGVRAREVFGLIRGCAGVVLDVLRLVMSRLVRAKYQEDYVSKAIDLGVACEALLVPEKSGRIRRTLGKNAAALLAPGDPGAGQRLDERFRAFYELRSQAVHRGRLREEAWREALKPPELLTLIEHDLLGCIERVATVRRLPY